MWYVVQVYGGKERETAELMRLKISGQAMEECFIPMRERDRKFQGRWKRIREILFPGYVFVETKIPEKLFEELRQVPKFTRLLRDDQYFFLPLEEKEARKVLELGDESHLTGISQVACTAGRQITVLSGPLKGREGNIVKVNLHKREVVVAMEFMGEKVEIFLGVEVVRER